MPSRSVVGWSRRAVLLVSVACLAALTVSEVAWAVPEPVVSGDTGSVGEASSSDALPRKDGVDEGSEVGDRPVVEVIASEDALVRVGEQLPDGVEAVEEVEQLRTEFSQTFATDEPELLVTEWSETPVHFEDAGEWVEIDESLEVIATEQGEAVSFEPRSTGFELTLGSDASQDDLVVLEVETGRLVYGLEGAAAVTAVPSDEEANRVRFPGVFPDVDLELVSVPEGVKDELVLHSADVPDRYVFPLAGTSFTPEVDEETGELSWLDDEGELALVSPAGWMQEMDGLPGDAAFSEGVSYELEGEGDGLALVLQLDREWLDDPDRRFPVLVDPTVQLSSESPAFLYTDTYYRQGSTSNYVNSADLITGRSDHRYHAFLQFGTPTTVPGSMTPGDGAHPIVSSTLTLTQNYSRNCQQPVFVKPVTQNWYLQPASHVSPKFGPGYDSAHAGFAATLPSTSVCQTGGNFKGAVNFPVTALVREFENLTRTNRGIAVVTSHTNDQTYRWFRSSEWTTASQRPKLTVVWRNQTPRMVVPVVPAANSSWTTTNKPTQLSLNYADDDGDWGWIEYTLHRVAANGTRTTLFTNRRSPGGAVASGPSPVALTAAQLTPGRYEWRARSFDGSSYSAVSTWRAFTIEQGVPPSEPVAPLSLTHLPWVGSANPRPVIRWGPGTSQSGVAGYSWTFSTSPAANPDNVVEGTALRAQPPSDLAAGRHYFAVRTVDTAGNVSPVARYGPIVIDPHSSGVGPILGLTDLLEPPEAASDDLGVERWMPVDTFSVGGSGQGLVNLDTGNAVVRFRDVEIPAQGLNVVIDHVYNSQAAEHPNLVERLLRIGSGDREMGDGWQLSISDAGGASLGGAVAAGFDANQPIAAFDLVTGVTSAITGRVVEFTDGDGTSHRFVREGGTGGRWHAPPGLDLRLREFVVAGRPNAYEFIRPDGVVYRAEQVTSLFSDPLSILGPQWRVVSVTDRNGNRLTYDYGLHRVSSAVAPVVRLDAVRHNRVPGIMVDLQWHANGTIDRIVTLPGHTAADPGDAAGATRNWERTIDYTVSSAGQLTEVVTNAHLPSGDPARTRTRFGYDTAATSLFGNQPRLTTITDPRGGVTRLGYRGNEQVLTSVTDRTGKVRTYGYTDGDDGGRVTTKSDPLGGITTYTISGKDVVDSNDPRIAGGNIVSITDAGFDDGEPITERFTWHANRLSRSTDGAGADTVQTYDGLGQVTAITVPSPNDPTASDLPADAPTVPIASTLSYRYSGKVRTDGNCGAAPATSTNSAQASCYGIADLTRTVVASNVPAQQRETVYSPNVNGNLGAVTVRDDDGDRTVRFTYYDNGALATVDGPRTDVVDITRYGDASDPATGGYDRSGQPRRIVDAAGNAIEARWTPYGQPASQTDRDGGVTRWRHDDRGLLVTEIDRRGAASVDHARYRWQHTYDANGNRTSSTTPKGLVTTTTFDGMDRPTVSSRAGQWRSITLYNADGVVASEFNPVGGVTRFDYHPNGLLRQVTAPADASPAVTTYGYDAAGRVSTEVGPAVDAAGTRPERSTVYSPAGLPVREESTSAVAGQDAVREIAYNANGEPIRTTGPRTVGGTLEQSEQIYDRLGQLRTARQLVNPSATGDARWLTTRNTYDQAGNVQTTTRPAGAPGLAGDLTTEFVYDRLGQLIRQSDPTNTGRYTTYTYSPGGRQLTRVDRAVNDDRPLRTVAVAYNADDSVASQVATDHATGHTLAACAYPSTGPTSAGYDDDGLPTIIRTLRSTTGTGCASGTRIRQQQFTYDAHNRIQDNVQIVRAPTTGTQVSRTQSYSYHADDTFRTITHDGKTTTYDNAGSGSGWNTTLTDWRGVQSTFAYTPAGSRRQVSYGSAATATLTHRPSGVLASLTWTAGDSLVRRHDQLGYDVGGQRTGGRVNVLLPDGTRRSNPASWGYDLAGRLSSYRSPFNYSSEIASSYTASYALDDAGNITAETIGRDQGPIADVSYTYANNRLERLVRDEHAFGARPQITTTTDLTYDLLGQETRRAVQVQQGLAGTQVSSATADRVYDPAGFVAAVDQQPDAPDDDVAYTYDLTERVLTRTGSGTGPAKAGDRIMFYFGMTEQLAEETDQHGNTIVTYLVDGQMNPVGQQSRRTLPTGAVDTMATLKWSWLLHDERGSVATVLDEDGQVIEQKSFDPYGKPETEGSGRAEDDPADPIGGWQPESTLGFQAANTDATTGNVLLGPRQYDPTTTRFTAPDFYPQAGLDVELGLDPLTGNRYLFAAANPVAYFEDGHRPTCSVYGDCRTSSGSASQSSPSQTRSQQASAARYEAAARHHQSRSRARRTVETLSGLNLATGGGFAATSGLKRALTLLDRDANSIFAEIRYPAGWRRQFWASTERFLENPWLRRAARRAPYVGAAADLGLGLADGQGPAEAAGGAVGGLAGGGIGVGLASAFCVASVWCGVGVGLAAIGGAYLGGQFGRAGGRRLDDRLD